MHIGRSTSAFQVDGHNRRRCRLTLTIVGRRKLPDLEPFRISVAYLSGGSPIGLMHSSVSFLTLLTARLTAMPSMRSAG